MNKKPETKHTGQKLMKISLIMLAVGAVFFEIVLDISGFFRHSGLQGIALPGILIGLGLLLLMNSLRGQKETPLWSKRRPQGNRSLHLLYPRHPH